VASQRDPHQQQFFELLELVKSLVYATWQFPAPSLDQTFDKEGNVHMNTYINI
jgi:hypothetical protein